jgi:hypothetical protein
MTDTIKERIKNLAIQARREVKRPGVFTEKEFEEKFTELIVRECAELCDINDKEQGDILRKHFGVEL